MSHVLVFGQFASIAILLFWGGWDLPWWAWLVFATGLGLFAWAGASLGGNNFTILPDPRAGNTLSQRGIYRFCDTRCTRRCFVAVLRFRSAHRAWRDGSR